MHISLLAESLWADVRAALRRLARSPLFTLFSIASVALGIGVSTAAYSLVRAALWPDTGVPEVDRTVLIVSRPANGSPGGRPATMSLSDFEAVRARQTTIKRLSASMQFHEVLSESGSSEVVSGEAVTGEYFEAVAVRASLGRVLGLGDDQATANAVVVLSERFWRTRFGGDPHVLGRVLRLNGQPFEVVGVAQQGFVGMPHLGNPGRSTKMWISLQSAMTLKRTAEGNAVSPTRPRLSVVGRIDGPEALRTASAEVSALGAQFDAAVPPIAITRTGPRAIRGWKVVSIRQHRAAMGTPVTMGIAVIALIGIVLLIACTNIANLMLSRGVARIAELRVMQSLGASRWRLFRGLITESLLVAVAGGIIGVLVSSMIVSAVAAKLRVAGVTVGQLFDPRLDTQAILFAVFALAIAALVFGVLPASQFSAAERMNQIVHGGASNQLRWRVQRHLIRWQVAMSATLLLVCAACVTVVVQHARRDWGVDLERLAVARVELRAQRWDEQRVRRAVEAITAAVRDEPGVAGAGIASGLSFGVSVTPWARVASTPEALAAEAQSSHAAHMIVATPGIFRALGVPVLSGRTFDQRDTPASDRVAVISERTAHALFEREDPTGRWLFLKGELNSQDRTTIDKVRIIGVAANAGSGSFASTEPPAIYLPLAQRFEYPTIVVARSSASVAETVTALRAAIQRTEPDVPVSVAGSGLEVLAEGAVALRYIALTTSAMGAFAMFLTLVGLHGVVSHQVHLRFRELGLRVALGATPRQIFRIVLSDAIRPVLGGVLIGLLGGALCRFAIRAAWGGHFSSLEPVVFAIPPALLVAGAVIACYWPAQRASRVDPNESLRVL